MNQNKDLGIGLKPGDKHYRAYVGPPEDYDFISAMVFNLLTTADLRQGHKLIDIGCGSLRCGRLFIPYLNKGNYYGIEPNKWLVEEGIEKEIGATQIELKNPVFSYRDDLSEFTESIGADFAVAQSIFSHTGTDLFEQWLSELSFHLKPTGALFGTYIQGEEDDSSQGWIYPGCIKFTDQKVEEMAAKYGFSVRVLPWEHPRQTWALFYKKDFNSRVIGLQGQMHWNAVAKKREHERWLRRPGN